MAGEELTIVRLKNDFYREGYYKVLTALIMIITAIILLGGTSIYLLVQKPAPVYFSTDNDWRVLAPVPLDQQYLNKADLLQWISDVLPNAFTYDFTTYDNQLKKQAKYFTTTGWTKFNDLVSTYANSKVIQDSKLFVNANAAGAPVILNQGLVSGKYAWWVQMPIVIHYNSVDKSYDTPITLQILIVRTSTLDDLSGVGIDNLILLKPGTEKQGQVQDQEQGQGGQARTNG